MVFWFSLLFLSHLYDIYMIVKHIYCVPQGGIRSNCSCLVQASGQFQLSRYSSRERAAADQRARARAHALHKPACVCHAAAGHHMAAGEGRQVGARPSPVTKMGALRCTCPAWLFTGASFYQNLKILACMPLWLEALFIS